MAPAAALSENGQTGHERLQSPRAQSNAGYMKVGPHYVEKSALEEALLLPQPSGRTKPDCSEPIKERDLARHVASALVVDFGHYKSTHKTIARIAGVNPDSVKRWVAAESAPSLVYFLRLLPHSPSLRRLVAMDSELSPDFQRELAALIARHIR